MKVAVVTQSFPEFSQTFVINHINSLIDSGLNVTIISFNDLNKKDNNHPQLAKNELLKKVRFGISIPKNKKQKLKLFLRTLIKNIFFDKNLKLLRTLNFFRDKDATSLYLYFKSQSFVKETKFDIIHCHFGNIGHDVEKLINLGIITGKLVVSFHGVEFLLKSFLQTCNNYKEVFKNSNSIIANSNFTRNKLIELGCNPSKIVIIPVTPDKKIFADNEINKDTLTKNDSFKILTIARLVEKKGLKFGILAAEILIHQYKIPLIYNIIGDGPLMTELNDLIISRNLENNVFLMGRKTQDVVFNFLCDTHIFLLPSIISSYNDTETQGLVLIEAQMMGKPVVASNVGGIPDSIINNKTGYLVQEKNPNEIATAILKLYDQPDVRESFGIAAKNFVEKNFNAELLTQKMIQTYKNIMN